MMGLDPEEYDAAAVCRVGNRGVHGHVFNPDMPWNEEIRATGGLGRNASAASPRTIAVVMPLMTKMDVRAVLPSSSRADARGSSTPMTH